MKQFFLITNEQKDPEGILAKQICDNLTKKGAAAQMAPPRSTRLCHTPDGLSRNALAIPETTDCVLVLGGDGTLLQAARDVCPRQIPLLGINLGTLGFLAEVEIQNVETALSQLLEDRYTLEERMMLRGDVIRQGKVILSDTSLNDICIVRRGHLRVVDFNIFVNDVFLCAYRADGIILSTPTGSTGYSLSAGGPIVSPDASLILMTAIAPHTLNTRPVILPDDVEVTVEVGGNAMSAMEGAEANFDGDTTLEVMPGDQIRVTKSEAKTRLVKMRHTSFVEMLRSKMN